MFVAVEKEIAGKILRLETGKIAKQAHGSVMVKSGDSVVLCVAVEGNPRVGIDFFPLMCDYREKMYSAGKIPGSFFRREARPATRETMVSRLIDRPIRPNFPKGYKNEVQVDCHVMSFDPDHNPDVLAMTGASAALGISHIPFQTVMGAVRVGYVGGDLIVNPTEEQMVKSELDLVVAGSKESIMMVESWAKELSEDILIRALGKAHDAIRAVVDLQEELIRKAGSKKIPFVPAASSAALSLEGNVPGMIEAFQTPEKKARHDRVDEFKAKLMEKALAGASEKDIPKAKEAFDAGFAELKRKAMREMIFRGKRCDGRTTTQIRPISTEVGILPRTHGSALFTRGETQALVTCTLGTTRDSMLIDDLNPKRYDSFLLHYNFPHYSVGETGPTQNPGRREIGHGMLALRALSAVMPSQENFPYTVRVVSEITESNGSSSMASVCGGALALMDAGVPVAAPVAGIAMGLIKDGAREAILSDILGDEDHYGDMDFKVAGTRNGVTALQMDIKVSGLSHSTMEKALQQARDGRLHILSEMEKTLGHAKTEISGFAPRYYSVKINPEVIGKLIGPGGKMIRSIQEETGAEVTVEDDGSVMVFSKSDEAAQKAMARIKSVTELPEVGKAYDGEVKSVRDFGAFVEIIPGVEGLLHISEISEEYVSDINKVVTLGDKLRVVVSEVDEKTGKMRLVSEAKYLKRKERGEPEPSRPPRRERSDRHDRGDRGRGRSSEGRDDRSSPNTPRDEGV